MMCSGEETTCIAACQGRPPALIGDCIAALPDAGQLLQAHRLLGQRDQPLLRPVAAVMSHGLASSIAAAAAMNGSGSDTAARSQTTRAGIIGISQITRRWIA